MGDLSAAQLAAPAEPAPAESAWTGRDPKPARIQRIYDEVKTLVVDSQQAQSISAKEFDQMSWWSRDNRLIDDPVEDVHFVHNADVRDRQRRFEPSLLPETCVLWPPSAMSLVGYHPDYPQHPIDEMSRDLVCLSQMMAHAFDGLVYTAYDTDKNALGPVEILELECRYRDPGYRIICCSM